MILKILSVGLCLFIFCSSRAQKDSIQSSLPNKIVNPVMDFPYMINKKNLTLKLPPSLKIDSIQGRLFASISLIKDSIIDIEWIRVSLKNKENNCFIEYSEAIGKNYELQDYPLPIRPYVKYFEKKLRRKELISKKKGKDHPKGKWYLTLPFEVY